MRTPATRWLRGGFLCASSVLGLAICLAIAPLASSILFAVYAATGGYLVAKVPPPAQRIGWLLILAGWGIGVGGTVIRFDPAVLSDGTATVAQSLTAWANSSGWAFGFVAFVTLAIVFPSGRLPSGAAGVIARCLVAGTIVLAVIICFGPTINVTVPGQAEGIDAPNPFTIVPTTGIWASYPGVPVLYPFDFVIFLGALGLLVVRFARSTGSERLQYRWLVASVVLAAIVNAIWAVATFGLGQDADGPANLATTIVYGLVPMAIAVAVLRYRLYDIDRIISRTIAYSATVVVLAAVFALAILGISSLLASFAQGRSVAVAAATLLAYFAAQPVARAVRAAVDRRFDRARYDAERTASQFSDRLRTETDVDAVTLDLIATTRATVAPRSSSVWIR